MYFIIIHFSLYLMHYINVQNKDVSFISAEVVVDVNDACRMSQFQALVFTVDCGPQSV